MALDRFLDMVFEGQHVGEVTVDCFVCVACHDYLREDDETNGVEHSLLSQAGLWPGSPPSGGPRVTARYVGSHTINTGGIDMAVRRSALAGGTTLQLFTAIPKYYG
ncbi:MAG TPA: hypothetical protein VM347_21505, partial [Nonomuraea sp.]|nr:hypothetical protein [Nonomuraea sp.]